MRSLILFAAVASVLAAAGCDFPRGARGKTGPLAEPPYIETITPESGSANTVWTIRGANFGPESTVTFDGHIATVVSATGGELRVTHAFPAVSSTEIRAVTVESDLQVSNTHAVFAVPSGSLRESDERRIWRHIDSFVALEGGLFYVLDAGVGLFRLDQASGAITRIADASSMGVEVQGLYRAGPDVFLVTDHESLNGSQTTRLSRVTGNGLELRLQMTGNVPITSLAQSPAGELYYSDLSNLHRLATDGTYDVSFFSGGFAGGLVFQGNTLYASDPALDAVVTVDTTNGTRTPFASSLANPAALEADRTGLLVVDDTGMRRIAENGAVTPVYPAYPISQSVRPDDGAVFMVVDFYTQNDTSIVQVESETSLRIVASGMSLPIPMAIAGEWTVTSDFNELVNPETPGELMQGVTLAFSATEARVLSTEAYSMVSYAPVDDTRVLYSRFAANAARSEIGFLDVASGATQVLADEGDGMAFLYTFAYEPLSGDVFVESYATGDTAGSFARIQADGTVIHDFAVLPADHIALASVVSGDYLWASGIDGNEGPLLRVSLATGGKFEAVGGAGSLLGVIYDGLCSDGRGGVFAADTLTGTIWHVDAEGEFDPITVLDTEWMALSMELDPRTGDLIATVYDGSASRIVPITP